MLPVWVVKKNSNKCPHTEKKATDLRKKAIKCGALTIKCGLAQIHIADENDSSASESMGRSDFEEARNTYSPGSTQLSFHIMDRRVKL